MTKVRKKVDFKGEKIYVGIDVHKKSWTVAVCTEHTNYRPFNMEPKPESLVNYLRTNYPGAEFICAYEVGFSGYSLYEYLTEEGICCLVVNPADIPTTSWESEFKNDQRDARKIAQCLRSGQLRPIHIPSKQLQGDRSLVRFRRQIRKDLVRQKSRIRSLLMFYGIQVPDEVDSKGRWSERFRHWLWNLELPKPSASKALHLQMGMLEYIRGMRNNTNSHLQQLSNEQRYIDLADLLQTVPGVGRHTAVKILVELGDIKRFPTLDQLCSHVGLVPASHNSGENVRQGRLTYRGHRELRTMLVEAAWTAIGVDPALERTYQELKKRMIPPKAIIRIARKLLARIRHVLLTGEPYEKGIIA